MRAVQRNIVVQEQRETSVASAGHRLVAVPEQTVMHQQQLAVLLQRAADGGLARVDGSRHAPDLRAGLHLQPVQCVPIVRHAVHRQIVVEVGSQLARRHLDAALDCNGAMFSVMC